MKRGGKVLILLFIFIFLLSFLSSLISSADFEPYLNTFVSNNPLSGIQKDYETNLFSGASTYDYPIEISPGTNSLQPSLSLSYYSHKKQDFDPYGSGKGENSNSFATSVPYNIGYRLPEEYSYSSLGSRYKSSAGLEKIFSLDDYKDTKALSSQSISAYAYSQYQSGKPYGTGLTQQPGADGVIYSYGSRPV